MFENSNGEIQIQLQFIWIEFVGCMWHVQAGQQVIFVVFSIYFISWIIF